MKNITLRDMHGRKKNVTYDLSGVVNKINFKINQSTYYAATIIKKEVEPFVPIDTGNLRNSATLKPYDKGHHLIYTADYAHDVYYDANMRHNGITQYHWFDAAKSLYLTDWVRDLNSLLNK